jgi:hypothetical protein
VRVLVLLSGFGVLAIAGLALAQENLIIDPWAKPPAALDRAGSRSVADGAVLPPVPAERTPLWAEGWSDPPTSSPTQAVARPIARRAPAVPSPVAAATNGVVAWAKPLDMIVDPWQSVSHSTVTRDFAIVDPWLH